MVVPQELLAKAFLAAASAILTGISDCPAVQRRLVQQNLVMQV
jgi:hypothetical protein